MKNLVLNLSGSMETDHTIQEYYVPRVFELTTKIDTRKYGNTQKKRFNTSDYLTYSFKNKIHSFSAMAGMEIQYNYSYATRFNQQDFLDSNVTYVQNALRDNTVSETIRENAMLSFFGRLNYSYKGKYIAAFTIRRDGSSRFGPDRRFGNFPSAQLAWRFSSEKFMKWAKPVLHDAKLRASWG